MKTNVLFACLFMTQSLMAQTLEKSRIDKIIDSVCVAYNNPGSAGLAISVMLGDSVITRKNYGMANLEHSIAFKHDTPVRLGYSGSREFMCTALAMMENENLLRFDDQVRNYFPDLPPWSASVTIQDLLNHSSGFEDEWATMLLMQADMNNRVDKEQLLRMLYDQPAPQVEPGKGYMYSNSDFALLRFIMEKASKTSLPDYLSQKLFGPLKMSTTFMNDDLGQLIPGLATTYYGGEGRYFKEVGVKTSPGGNYRIVTTASDLEKWARALDDSLSAPSVAIRRLHRQARPIPVLSPEVHFVFGHEHQVIGETRIIRHGGVDHDFYMTRIPSKKITIVGLGNNYHSMSNAMSVANHLLEEKSPRKPSHTVPPPNAVHVNSEETKNYAGRYFEQIPVGHSSHLANIRFYDVKFEGNNLNLYFKSDEYVTLVPLGKGYFRDPDYPVTLYFNQTDPAMTMQAWNPSGDTTLFIKAKPIRKLSKTELTKFTGQYHSKHLDFYCRVLINDRGELILRRPTITDKVLVPYGENMFIFEMQTVNDSWYVVAKFTKDKKGKIDGIDMQHVRLMHHRFDKVNKSGS